MIPRLSGHVLLVGRQFSQVIPGSDPDAGAAPSFSAAGLPGGATLDPLTGELRWTPSGVQVGDHDIRVFASDGDLMTSQTLRLVVSHAPIPPAVRIDLTPSFPVGAGQAVLVHASASGVADIASLAIEIDGQPQTLDQFGRARFRPGLTGRFTVVATATDVDGVRGTATLDLKVRDLSDRQAPVVELASPAEGAGLGVPADGALSTALVPLLPGLWAMLFGVAAFGARPYLPRATGWVALYYMTAGAWLLWHAGGAPPSAWAVGGTFGAGQLASAAVLYWNLERR